MDNLQELQKYINGYKQEITNLITMYDRVKDKTVKELFLDRKFRSCCAVLNRSSDVIIKLLTECSINNVQSVKPMWSEFLSHLDSVPDEMFRKLIGNKEELKYCVQTIELLTDGKDVSSLPIVSS
jgi:hypothetical protein